MPNVWFRLLMVWHKVNFRSMTAIDAERATAQAAASGAAVKRAYVKQMFSDIAPTYDRVNRLLSLRIDVWWRRQALEALDVKGALAGRYLDLCAGTMDVAAQIARVAGFRGHVLAADFAEPMLRAGVGKVADTCVAPVTADALALPMRDGSVNRAIVGFGIRNVADLDAGLREVYRVLDRGGRFVILEFGEPTNPVIRRAYEFYFNHILPRIGNAVAQHGTAYDYLPKSVANFPRPRELASRLEQAGFTNVSWRTMTFGIVVLHVAEKR